MVKYQIVIGVYIEDENTEKLKDFCKEHNLLFEDDFRGFHEDANWQKHYGLITGLTGKIKQCFISTQSQSFKDVGNIFDELEKLDFDMFINNEIS